MAKSVGEILKLHTIALLSGDIEEALSHYADDAVLIMEEGIYRGLDGVRTFMQDTMDNVITKNTKHTTISVHIEGDIAYAEWIAESDKAIIEYAADTFIIRDGKILVQTAAAVMKMK